MPNRDPKSEVRTMLFEGKDRRELEQLMKREGRLPPGQSLTLKWPVRELVVSSQESVVSARQIR
jgi:hypothetical protein